MGSNHSDPTALPGHGLLDYTLLKQRHSVFVDLVRKTENEKTEKGKGNQEFKHEVFIDQ